MKKILGLVLIVSLAGVIFWQINKNVEKPVPAEKILGAPQTSNQIEVEGYQVAWAGPFEGDDISLIANFEDKLGSSQALEEFDCRVLVNGGFVTEDYQPIGLFISDGEVIHPEEQNNLFNGFFSINDFATPRITKTQPRDHLVSALQAGPVLIENTQVQKLSLASDKPARRIVAITTGENTVYFLAVYNADQKFEGPLLADLPDVLRQIQGKMGVIFADAINLDGGVHSVFVSDNFKLSEVSPAGSFFCID